MGIQVAAEAAASNICPEMTIVAVVIEMNNHDYDVILPYDVANDLMSLPTVSSPVVSVDVVAYAVSCNSSDSCGQLVDDGVANVTSDDAVDESEVC